MAAETTDKVSCIRHCTFREGRKGCIYQTFCPSRIVPDEIKEDMADKRVCKVCGRELDISEFYGHDHTCRKCRIIKNNKRRAERNLEEKARKVSLSVALAIKKDESPAVVATCQDETKIPAVTGTDISKVTDIELKQELERRGWTVTAKRTIVEEL